MSSEQALTLLEKSKDDPKILVDQAAAIIHFQYDETRRRYIREKSSASSTKSPSFRSQWVLKWLLKRLKETALGKVGKKTGNSQTETHVVHSNNSLFDDAKAWALLLALMDNIPSHTLCDILLERDFTQLLVFAWESLAKTHISQDESSSFNEQENSQFRGEHDTPSAKRRRLSPPESNNSKTLQEAKRPQSDEVLLLFYLRAVDRYAQVIRVPATSQPDLTIQSPRSISAVWARNINEASQLVGGILQASVQMLTHQSSLYDDESINAPVSTWLSLWQEYATSNAFENSTINKAFCEFCLNSCLAIYGIARNDAIGIGNRNLRKAIERQIVLNVILPLRAGFNEQMAVQWKSVSECITWNHVRPLYDQMVSHFGKALKSEHIMGVEYLSFQHFSHASFLYTIAAKIISRDDTRRQLWERPWLNALLTVLMHLAFPQHMYRLQEGTNGVLEAEHEDLPYDARNATPWPYHLLQAVHAEGTELSSSVSIYVWTGVLRWRSDQPPIPLLAKLVELNVEVFVPQAKNPNRRRCLDLLLERVENSHNLEQDGFEMILNRIVFPVMQGFALSRDIGEFVEIWVPRLQDALRARLENRHNIFDPVFIHDDENLFRCFEEMVREFAPRGFSQKILRSVVENMRTMTQRVGSTIDISADIAILIPVLRVKTEAVPASELKSDLLVLRTHVIEALQQQSDYQGQRWRMWLLLNVLEQRLKLGGDSKLQQLVSQHPPRFWKHFQKDTTYHSTPYYLMEGVQAFATITKVCLHSEELDKVAGQHLLDVINYLRTTHSSDPEKTWTWLHLSWNGKLSDVTSIGKLVCGYVGHLVQANQASLAHFKPVLYSAVQQAAYQAACQKNLRNDSLGKLFQHLLAAFNQLDKTNLFGCYADSYIREKVAQIPPILEHLALEGLSKKKAAAFADILVERLLKHENSFSHIYTASGMAILSRIVRTYAVSIGHPQNFQKLIEVSRIVDNNGPPGSERYQPMKEIDLLASQASLTNIAKIIMTRIEQAQPPELRSELTRVVSDWCMATITSFKSRPAVCSELLLLDAFIGSHSNQGSTLFDSKTSIQDEYTKYILAMSSSPDHTALLLYLSGSGGSITQALSTKDNSSPSESQLGSKFLQLRSKPRLRESLSAATHYGQGKAVRHQTTTMGNLQDELNLTVDNQLLSKTDLTNILQTLIGQHTNGNLEASLQLANFIIRVKDETVEQHPGLKVRFSQLAEIELPNAKSAEQLVLHMEICKTVLVSHPQCIRQSTIDSLLRALSVVSSSTFEIDTANTNTDSESALSVSTAIYDRLIHVFGILLSRYRRRLNGRSHLVVPVLQNLMKCLFYTPERKYIYQNPASTKQKEAFRKSLPCWLSLGNAEPLPPSCADKLSRILTSICNPTIASARSAHKTKKRKSESSLELNDETQKAKRLASRYMQYVLIEYAKSSLDGIMAPESREKLLPGLFAILDCLDSDLMRAMNTSMDPSCRAIFKGLFDEWLKFGKWNQS